MSMMNAGIPCQEMTEKVTSHMEGAQSWGEWLRFRWHIMMCKDCRAYLQQMRMTVATLARMPNEPLPEEVGEELMRRYREWQEERNKP